MFTHSLLEYMFVCVCFAVCYVKSFVLYKETRSIISFEGQPVSRILESAVHSEQLSERPACASGLRFQTWKQKREAEVNVCSVRWVQEKRHLHHSPAQFNSSIKPDTSCSGGGLIKLVMGGRGNGTFRRIVEGILGYTVAERDQRKR